MVKHLTLEILNDIVQVEKQADHIVKQAHLEGKEMHRQAEVKAETIVNELVFQAYSKTKEQMKATEEDVQAITKEKQAMSKKECENIKINAAKHIENAVNTVIERIVSMNGNC